MNAEEFVTAVERSMPTRETLIEYGLDEDEIDGIQAAFRCPSRGRATVPRGSVSELERLVIEYDCSTLEVSLLRFTEAPKSHEDGVIVAYWEADPVMVTNSGEIVAIDHENPNGKSTPCGADSERFLAAIAFLVEGIGKKAQWRGRAAELAEACAERAGGAVFSGFFGSLTAFLDG